MAQIRHVRRIALAIAVAGGTLLAAGSAPGADGTPVPSAAAPIVLGIDAGGGPYLGAHDGRGGWRAGFVAYFDFTVGGVNVAAGDVDGDGVAEIVTAPGSGGRGELRTFTPDGERRERTILATTTGCGLRIAAGDVSGDGKADLVTGLDRCTPNIQVYDGASGERIASFGAFSVSSGEHGVRVAVGDVVGDERPEVIAANGPGDAPVVRIFPATPREFFPEALRMFDAFEPSMTSGLEVAAADVAGDGKAELIVGAETPDDPQVKVLDGSTGSVLRSFRPFGLVAPGTLRVAAGDVDGDGRAEIVVGGTQAYLPAIRIFSAQGELLSELSSPPYNARALAVEDLDGDGKAEIVTTPGPGYDASVSVLDRGGSLRSRFQAYPYSFINGVRVAAGDLDGDGRIEYVTGQGPGGASELVVFDQDGVDRTRLHPFGQTWEGLYVAAGDVDGDAKADVVAAKGWGEPRVKTLDGKGKELASFLAYDPSFQGGVRVATGDLDDDGVSEIVTAPGPGGPPVVRVFDSTGKRRASFYGFDPAFADGLYVAAGDLDGDGRAEIVVGSGTTPEVRVLSGDGVPRTSFDAYVRTTDHTDGVRVAVGDVNGDGTQEIVTAPGRFAPVVVRTFRGNGVETGSFLAHPEFEAGLFVAVPAPLGPRLRLDVRDVRGTEGRQARLVASFLDPRGGAAAVKFGARVVWGDGSVSTEVVSALGNGRYRIDATKSYLEYGRYGISVRITDANLRAANASAVARITDAPLVALGRSISTSRLFFRGVVASVEDGNRSGSPQELRVRIAWGDGGHSGARLERAARGRFRVVAAHRFRRPGVYRVVVRIRSVGGSTAATTSIIRVTASPS
jgi:FG-GAP-like repeat